MYSHPIIEKIMKIPENKFCFDCGLISPKWASINNGIFICLKCAGIHRGFGVHISFVRSLTMDNWYNNKVITGMKIKFHFYLKEEMLDYQRYARNII